MINNLLNYNPNSESIYQDFEEENAYDEYGEYDDFYTGED
jgi:hypothetical protein